MTKPSAKIQRCRLAKCPLADANDPRCGFCIGPLAWPDGKGGWRHAGRGAHRACTNCPMNGLGLPVCWAGCIGPGQAFATDGQEMVALGSMVDQDAYIERYAKRNVAVGGCGVLQSAGRDETNWNLLKCVARAVLALDAHAWEELRRDLQAGAWRKVAQRLSIPLAAIRPDADSGADGWKATLAGRLLAPIAETPGKTWEMVRLTAMGNARARVGRLMGGVSRQAKSKAMKRASKKNGWIARLVEIVKKGCSLNQNNAV